MTAFNPCGHGTLQILSLNALGVTVGCVHCNETFDLPADVMEEKYYHFVHHSGRGPEHDMELLIHHKIIER